MPASFHHCWGKSCTLANTTSFVANLATFVFLLMKTIHLDTFRMTMFSSGTSWDYKEKNTKRQKWIFYFTKKKICTASFLKYHQTCQTQVVKAWSLYISLKRLYFAFFCFTTNTTTKLASSFMLDCKSSKFWLFSSFYFWAMIKKRNSEHWTWKTCNVQHLEVLSMRK